MSQTTRTRSAASNTEWDRRAAAAALRKNAPVLITEKQVAFSTAAGVSVGSRRRERLNAALMARLGRFLSASTQPRPHPVRRDPAYFEGARMSREMDRL
jgi:hypothetical protein